jgi:hypothetical protein
LTKLDPPELDELPGFEATSNVLLIDTVSIFVVDNCALEDGTEFGNRTEYNENEWTIDTVVRELLNAELSVARHPCFLLYLGKLVAYYAKDIAGIAMSVNVENESEFARDDRNPNEHITGMTGLIYDSGLAPKDDGVVEDSICGRVTDTVFVKDDPCGEGKDRGFYRR